MLVFFAALLHEVRGDLPVHCLHHQVAGKWIFHVGRFKGSGDAWDPLCGFKRPDAPGGPDQQAGGHGTVTPQGCGNSLTGAERLAAINSKECLNGDADVMTRFASNFVKTGEVEVVLGGDNAGWAASLRSMADSEWADQRADWHASVRSTDRLEALQVDPAYAALNKSSPVESHLRAGTSAGGLWTMIYNEGFHASLAEDASEGSTGTAHEFITFSSYKIGPGGHGSSIWKENAKYSNCAQTLIGWYHRHPESDGEDTITRLEPKDRMCWWGEQVAGDPGMKIPYLVPETSHVDAPHDPNVESAESQRQLIAQTNFKALPGGDVGPSRLLELQEPLKAPLLGQSLANVTQQGGPVPPVVIFHPDGMTIMHPTGVTTQRTQHGIALNASGPLMVQKTTTTGTQLHPDGAQTQHKKVVIQKTNMTGRVIGYEEFAQMHKKACEVVPGMTGDEHLSHVLSRGYQDLPSVLEAMRVQRGTTKGSPMNGFGNRDQFYDSMDAETLKDFYLKRVELKEDAKSIWPGWDAKVHNSPDFIAGNTLRDFDWRHVNEGSGEPVVNPLTGASTTGEAHPETTNSKIHVPKMTAKSTTHSKEVLSGSFQPTARDQGPCGSCYDVAVSTMLTARLWLRYPDLMKEWRSNNPGETERDRTVSWKHNLDCNQMNQGCEGGYPYYSLMWGQDQDLPDSECYPHTTDVNQAFDVKKDMCDAKKDKHGAHCHYAVRVHQFGYIGGAYGLCNIMQKKFPGSPEYSCEYAMRAEMYRGGPIGVAIEPSPQFGGHSTGVFRCVEGLNPEKAGYPGLGSNGASDLELGASHLEKFQSLVMIGENEVCPPGNDCYVWERVDHAIVAIGWGEMEVEGPSGKEMVKYWIVQNSWGETWNGDGSMKIERGKNCMAIESITIAADPVLVRRTSYEDETVAIRSSETSPTHFEVAEDVPGKFTAGDVVVAVDGADPSTEGRFAKVTVEPSHAKGFFQAGAGPSLQFPGEDEAPLAAPSTVEGASRGAAPHLAVSQHAPADLAALLPGGLGGHSAHGAGFLERGAGLLQHGAELLEQLAGLRDEPEQDLYYSPRTEAHSMRGAKPRGPEHKNYILGL